MTTKIINSFFAQTNDAFVIVEKNGDILQWNTAQEELTGISYNEALGQKIWDLQRQLMLDEHKKHLSPKQVQQSFLEFAEKGTDQSHNATIRDKKGRVINISQKTFIERNDNSTHIGIISNRSKSIDKLWKTGTMQFDPQQDFWTNVSRELVAFSDLTSIYDYVIKFLVNLSEFKGFVIVSEYLNNEKQYRIVKIGGLPKILDKISNLLDFDITRLEGPINPKIYGKMHAGKMFKLPNNLNEVTNGMISTKLDPILRKLVGIKSLYCINFKEKDEFYGTVTLIYAKNSIVLDQTFLESYVALVSLHIKRVIAEQNITESNLKFKAIVENSSDGVYIYKGNRFLFVNQTACRLSGYPNDEFMRLEPFDIIADEDRKRILKYGQNRAMGKSSPANYIAKVLCKDKTIKECEFTVTTIPLNNESVFMGVVKDLSQQRKAELAIQESEEKLRIVAERANEVVWLFSPNNTRLLYVNQAYENVWGKPTEKLYLNPNSFFDSIHPDDKSRVETLYGLLDEKNFIELEYRIYDKAGCMKWISEKRTKVFDDTDEFIAIHGIASDITQSKNIQIKLEESENNLKKAQELAHIGYFKWNIKTNFVEWSDSLYDIHGFSKQESPPDHKRYLKHVHPSDQEYFEKNLSLAFKKGCYGSDYKIVHEETGKTKYIHSEAKVLYDASGNPECLLGVDQDVTASKEKEDAVLHNERKYKQLFDTMNDGCIILEPIPTKQDFLIVDSNRSLERIEKTNKQSIIGKIFSEAFPSVADSGLLKKTLYVAKKGKPIEFFVSIEEKGTLRCVHNNRIFKLSENRIGIIYNDITVQHMAQKAIELSEEKYRTVIETAREAIFIIKDGIIKFANQALLEINNAKEKDVVGKKFLDFIPEEEHDRVMKFHIERMNAPPPFIRYDSKAKTISGEIREVEVSSSIIQYEGGPAVLVLLHDITGRKKAEQKLQQHKKMLEQTVAERTKQLEQQNLTLGEKNSELEQFNKLFVGREFRIKELRDKVMELEKEKANMEKQIEELKKQIRAKY